MYQQNNYKGPDRNYANFGSNTNRKWVSPGDPLYEQEQEEKRREYATQNLESKQLFQQPYMQQILSQQEYAGRNQELYNSDPIPGSIGGTGPSNAGADYKQHTDKLNPEYIRTELNNPGQNPLLNNNHVHSQRPLLYQQQDPIVNQDIFLKQKKVNSVSEFSTFVYVNKNNIPIIDWDPLIDYDRKGLQRIADKDSPISFNRWYIDKIQHGAALDTIREADRNPFNTVNLKYIDTYRYAKPWWKNETDFKGNLQE
jgi:hypothetical protein